MSAAIPLPHHIANMPPPQKSYDREEQIPFTTYSTGSTQYEGLPLKGKESTTDFSISTGWTLPLYWLLFNGLISFFWGAALVVFALGVVPIDWEISERAKHFPETTNFVVAQVASLATLHVTYIFQDVLENYSHVLAVDGFSLGQMRWMQGVKEMSIWTRFPARRSGGRLVWWSKKRMLWVLIYLIFLGYTSSLVAILQPG